MNEKTRRIYGLIVGICALICALLWLFSMLKPTVLNFKWWAALSITLLVNGIALYVLGCIFKQLSHMALACVSVELCLLFCAIGGFLPWLTAFLPCVVVVIVLTAVICYLANVKRWDKADNEK